MRAAEHSSVQGRSAHSILSSDELASVLSHGLDLPLAALRASMESLNEVLPADAKGNGPLHHALREVGALGRNVRELVEFASAPEPMPLRCTASEIAVAARGALSPTDRPHVMVARLANAGTLHTDAPLLTRCLRRLIQNSLEAGSEHVLLTVRHENGYAKFTVIDASPQKFDAEWACSAFHSTKSNHLGLGLSIARRDVELLAGTLEIFRSDSNETSVVVTVPESASAPLNGSSRG